MPNLGLLAEQAGLKHVVISFVLAKNNACDPAWYGTEPLDWLKADIELFRRAGGSITVATGGAEGTYIENACATSTDLAGAYMKILDATGTNFLDVDIEHDVQIDKVIDAMGQVQRARGTDITLTLPVDPDGLGPGQLNLVKKAVRRTSRSPSTSWTWTSTRSATGARPWPGPRRRCSPSCARSTRRTPRPS